MKNLFTFTQFVKLYPDDNSCLEEIKILLIKNNSKCPSCGKTTKFYKIKNRPAYTCKYCRYQLYPLANTIFEKSSTSLRIWFYVMFIMTQTKARISIKQLQEETGVTYKTAWRIYTSIKKLMLLNNGDLLAGNIETDETYGTSNKIFKWTLFNTVVFSVVHKDDPSATTKN
jgi:transposase-like protein